MSQFPNGKHVSEVSSLKDRQRDKHAYEIARKDRGNIQSQILALKNYIQRFPNGRYIDSAREAIDSYQFEMQAEQDRMIARMREGHMPKRQILDMLDSGKIQESDLVPKYISKAGFDFYRFGRNVELGINEELGPIRRDSTDVYFIGVPNSGKSCLLAGLLLFC